MGMDNGIIKVPHHALNQLMSEYGEDLSPYYDGDSAMYYEYVAEWRKAYAIDDWIHKTKNLDENINYYRLSSNDIVELLKYIGELLRNTNDVTEQFAVTLPYSCIDDLGKIYAAMLTDNVNIDGKIVPLYDYYYYVSR